MSPTATEVLVSELRTHALVLGRVTLTSGREADYYVDVKRAILRPTGFAVLTNLIGDQIRWLKPQAVGGLTMGADPIACAALAGGADVKAFFVRKEAKVHGLARTIEGPPLEPDDRVLIVEDVVTTGGSTLRAIDKVKLAGLEIVGVVSVLDRLAGGAESIQHELGDRVPYIALTTIDQVYPDRPDRS